jgi:hypothetical protein
MSNFKFDEFKKAVESLEPGIKYDFPEDFRYKWMKITFDMKEGFSWAMERNYKVSGMGGYVYPLISSGQYVKFFKTIAGTKRNLIKRCEFCFKNE